MITRTPLTIIIQEIDESDAKEMAKEIEASWKTGSYAPDARIRTLKTKLIENGYSEFDGLRLAESAVKDYAIYKLTRS